MRVSDWSRISAVYPMVSHLAPCQSSRMQLDFLYMAFAQSVLGRHAICMHKSCTGKHDRAYAVCVHILSVPLAMKKKRCSGAY